MFSFVMKTRIGLVVTTGLIIIVLAHVPAFASSLTGKVVDSANRPLIGVSVALMDSTKMLTSTATNYDGQFVINVAAEWPDSLALRLSSVGYQRRDILLVKPSAHETLTIILKPAVPPTTGGESANSYGTKP